MTPIEKLVNFFGGQAKTAAALGVTQAAVSYWFHGAHTMSATKAFLAEELTGGLSRPVSFARIQKITSLHPVH